MKKTITNFMLWKIIYNPERKIERAFYVTWKGEIREMKVEELKRLIEKE